MLLAALLPISFLGSFVFGLTGFGSGLVTVPLASFLFDLPFVLAVFSVIDGLNAVRVWRAQPKAVSWEDAKRLLPSCIVGVGVATPLLLWLPTRPLLLAFGGFVFAYAVYGLLAPKRLPIVGTGWAYLAGLISGITSTLFGAGGPPFVIYLGMRPLVGDQFRGTLAVTGVVSIGARIVAFALGGLLSSPKVWIAILLVAPASLVALWIAQRIHTRIPRATMLRGVQLLLCVAGASLVHRALGMD
jgi:uncharacterized membrane protein YfcA